MSTYGLWLSAAGMKINEHRQTLLANNLANANTVGFKEDLAVVMQRRVESREGPAGLPLSHPVLDGLSGGVNVQPVYTTREQGPIEVTDRPLDIAIRGDGYFVVSDGATTRYTRNGQFTTNAAGELVMSSGHGRWKVLDAAGSPIRLSPSAGQPEVADDGTVRQGGRVAGRIDLATHENPRMVRKVGENLFESVDGRMTPASGRLTAGSLEGSTFDAVRGLASMIEVSRAYQMNATLLQLADDLTGQAVQTLGRAA